MTDLLNPREARVPSIPRVAGVRRCSVCQFTHEGGFGAVHDPAYPTASEATVAVAQQAGSQQAWLDAWGHAATVHWTASALLDSINAVYRASDRKQRLALRPARDIARRNLCDAIAAMWLLPHPTQTLNVRVGCM